MTPPRTPREPGGARRSHQLLPRLPEDREGFSPESIFSATRTQVSCAAAGRGAPAGADTAALAGRPRPGQGQGQGQGHGRPPPAERTGLSGRSDLLRWAGGAPPAEAAASEQSIISRSLSSRPSVHLLVLGTALCRKPPVYPPADGGSASDGGPLWRRPRPACLLGREKPLGARLNKGITRKRNAKLNFGGSSVPSSILYSESRLSLPPDIRLQ